MDIFYLFGFGVVALIVLSWIKDNPIQDGIDRLNNDVAKQMKKLKDPNRNSL